MIGAITLDVFHTEVGVFKSDKSRVKFLRKKGLTEIPANDHACFASSHMDAGPDGRAWFSMVIKPEANDATRAHECVHIADFLMDRFGIPTDVSNTEVRAYLVGKLFGDLQDMMEEQK